MSPRPRIILSIVNRGPWVVALAAAIVTAVFAVAIVGGARLLSSSDSRSRDNAASIKDIQALRQARIRDSATVVLQECQRNNRQDLLLAALLEASLEPDPERPPLTVRQRAVRERFVAAVENLQAVPNCENLPLVQGALREGIVLPGVKKREQRRPD